MVGLSDLLSRKEMHRALAPALAIVALMSLPMAAQEPGPLTTARDLYASARYDEALTVLNGLRTRDTVDRRSVEQYRSLCLLALGRAAEAETAIAAVVNADPLYRPDADAPPRVRAMFSDVRKRMLPDIATTRYVAAKASYDRKDWPAAERQFRVVLSLIDDPDGGTKLGDLRVLTAGFLELSARNAAPPPEPAPEPPPAPVTSPGPAAGRMAPSPTPSAPTRELAPVASAEPVANRIYGGDDDDVVVPIVVRQDIPSVPNTIINLSRPRGLIEVVIDEQGRVVNMAIRGSIHPSYDAQLLGAARDWKYKPATLNGQPVKFRKLIQVSVKR